MRYLLDEHIDPLIRAQLIRNAPDLDVWIVGDPAAPAYGTLDPQILEWCEDNGFVLVTNNRKSMPRHLADHLALDRHVPGILTVGAGMSIGELVDELLLIAGAVGEDEFRDYLLLLPIS